MPGSTAAVMLFTATTSPYQCETFSNTSGVAPATTRGLEGALIP